jgi:class 3 adenylate cyclase
VHNTAQAESKEHTNALGQSVISFARPLGVSGLDWVTVAEMPVAEASRQTTDFQKLMMLALALTTALTTMGAMVLSGLFVRPIRALTNLMQRVADGEEEVALTLDRQDEVGELAQSAQRMTDGFKARLADAETDRAGTEQLLNRFLPDGTVRTVTSRKGITGSDPLDDIVTVISHATFVMARLEGLDAVLASLQPEQAERAFDDLVQIIDVAADKHGVEKVRTAGSSYFAIAGLSTPQIDHGQRGIAFAIELRDLTERFARDNKVALSVRVGVDTGDAVSGVIGKQKLEYEVWGPPVVRSNALCRTAASGEIRVSEELAVVLRESFKFDTARDGVDGGMILQSPVTPANQRA